VQVEQLMAVGLILIAVLNETMGVSFLLPAAQCDLNLSTRDKGLLSSMTFLGIFSFRLLPELSQSPDEFYPVVCQFEDDETFSYLNANISLSHGGLSQVSCCFQF
jgi:hypothetical protein